MNAPTRTPEHSDLITRRAPIASGSKTWDAETRTLSAVIAAGALVPRWDGRGQYLEGLDPKGMIRPANVPVLNSHQRFDLKDVLGSVTAVETRDGKIEATLKFSRRAEVEPIIGDILDGHITGISVGYRVMEWREEAESAGKARQKTATKWELVEVSVVAVPADPAATIRSNPMTQQQQTAEGSVITPPAAITAPATQTRAETNTAIRSIAETAGLDRDWADAQIDAERTLDEARADAFAEMQRRGSEARRVRPTVQVGVSHDDPAVRVRNAGEAFYARWNPSHQLSEPARQFYGMTTLDLARESLRSAGIATAAMSAGGIIERALHSTSDFPLILGDAVGRSLLGAYRAAPSGLKLVGRQTTARDFREKHRLSLSEAPRLEKVNQSGEFTSGTLAEAKESYRLATYGKIIGITRQVLVNDDLGAFNDLARRMGQAAAATEAQLLVDLLISNSGNGPSMSDGKALFHADHKNKAASGATISIATLNEARTAMRRQVGLTGELIEVTPKFLVIPPELETLAEQILASLSATEAANVNPFSGKLSPVVEPRLTSATRWYVSADPASVDGLEYAYLEGEEGVQLETRSGFEVDGVQIRARVDFGAGFVDSRGWFVNAG